MAVRLIVSADDFGASEEVNAAIATAHRMGVLTCAGLMVAGRAARGAVEIAKNEPRLAVGLHLTLSNGSGVLAPERIPNLVDSESWFADSPTRAAMRYYFSARARRQLRMEIEAQFEAFAATGLRLSHVDGHQHLHAHPAVLPIVVELARKHGASGIRVPRDPVLPNLRADRSGLGSKAVTALGHAYLARCCWRALAGSGLATCDAVVGSMMSGRMTAGYVTRMIEQLDSSRVEVFFHPSVADSGQRFGPNRGDLRALLDPALHRLVEQPGYILTNYAGLANEEEACELG